MAGAAFAQAPAPQQQLHETLESLAKAKQSDVTLQQKQATLQKEMEQLQDHATALAERLQVSERRVTSQEHSLTEVNAKLDTKQKEFDARKTDYATTIATLLRLRELPPTALFAQPDHGRQLIETASILEKTNIAAAKKARRLAADLEELKTLKSEAKSQQEETNQETMALTAEQQQLAKSLRARQALQSQLSADHAHTEEKIASLSKASENLQSLISKLDKEAREQKTKQQPVKPKLAKPLTTAKGNLRAPVSGEVLHHYGDRKSVTKPIAAMCIARALAQRWLRPMMAKSCSPAPSAIMGIWC